MIESDTVKLLRECDAGIKMGIKSIEDVLDRTKSTDLKRILQDNREKHGIIDRELQDLLKKYHDEGKDVNFIAEKMAEIKTEIKLQMNKEDETIADLITDGCNMGVKSLNRYLNQYVAADEKSKDICKRLIDLESTRTPNLKTLRGPEMLLALAFWRLFPMEKVSKNR